MPFLKMLKRKGIEFIQSMSGWLMLKVVYYWPEQAYRFVPDQRLPMPHQRFDKEDNPLDEFQVSQSGLDVIDVCDEVHVAARGSSCDMESVHTLNGSVYLINWPGKIERENTYYATSDYKHLKRFIASGMFPIFFVTTDEYSAELLKEEELKVVFDDPRNRIVRYAFKGSDVENAAIGSGIPLVAALARKSGIVHVHGWDHYLNKSPREMNLNEMISMMNQPHPSFFPCAMIASCIYGFHYATRLSHEVPNIKNHGYTHDIKHFNSLTDKFERIFYNHIDD